MFVNVCQNFIYADQVLQQEINNLCQISQQMAPNLELDHAGRLLPMHVIEINYERDEKRKLKKSLQKTAKKIVEDE